MQLKFHIKRQRAERNHKKLRIELKLQYLIEVNKNMNEKARLKIQTNLFF